MLSALWIPLFLVSQALIGVRAGLGFQHTKLVIQDEPNVNVIQRILDASQCYVKLMTSGQIAKAPGSIGPVHLAAEKLKQCPFGRDGFLHKWFNDAARGDITPSDVEETISTCFQGVDTSLCPGVSAGSKKSPTLAMVGSSENGETNDKNMGTGGATGAERQVVDTNGGPVRSPGSIGGEVKDHEKRDLQEREAAPVKNNVIKLRVGKLLCHCSEDGEDAHKFESSNKDGGNKQVITLTHQGMECECTQQPTSKKSRNF